MPRLNRIVETALYVDDLDRAAEFYEAKLGLAPMGIKGAAKPNMSCSLMGSARGAAAFRWDC